MSGGHEIEDERIRTLEIKYTPASQPPSGYFRVVNLYVDPVTGRLIVQYDDTPV